MNLHTRREVHIRGRGTHAEKVYSPELQNSRTPELQNSRTPELQNSRTPELSAFHGERVFSRENSGFNSRGGHLVFATFHSVLAH
jgi:hypothetical protein